MLPNSNCKLPNIDAVAELAVWPHDGANACCVLQGNGCHLKSERVWAISLTPGLRRKQKCTAKGQGVEADGVHVFVDPAHFTRWGSCAWESSCTLTAQNRGLLLAGTILILGTHMLPSLHQYSHNLMSQLLLYYCLLLLLTWHYG